MKMFEISTNGGIVEQVVNKKNLAKEFDMHSRDLRPILFLRQLFTISVRGNGIVVNLGEVKLCIGQEKAYFFPMKNEKRQREFSTLIKEKIQNKSSEDHHIPFEFLILEVGFEFISKKISNRFNEFNKKLNTLLNQSSDNPTQEYFEELLRMKKELLRQEKQTQELQDALNEILEDDDEISDILLAEEKNEHFEEEDVESILENMLEPIMELSHKIYQQKENIDDMQEIITLKMANIRNIMMQLDLLATVGTAILAIGTLIAGFYGMNVENSFESSFSAFLIIVLGVLFASLISFFFFFKFLKKKKIWA